MSIQHLFGWDLPPGVSNADIERATDADYDNCPDCEGTGEACRKDENDDDGKCKRCEGTGIIDLSAEHAERQADTADR